MTTASHGARLAIAASVLAVAFGAGSQLGASRATTPAAASPVRAEPIAITSPSVRVGTAGYAALPELRKPPRHRPRPRREPSGPQPSPAVDKGPVAPVPAPRAPVTPDEPEPRDEPGDLIVQ